MGRPSVFVSYAHEDVEAAKRLYSKLKASGADPWLDTLHLIPGQNWKSAIRDAIVHCRYFVAILSSNSVGKRGFVQKELKIALELLEEFPEHGIFIIPVRLDNCHPSYERVQDLHWVDMFPNWDEGLSQVLRAIGIEKAAIKRPSQMLTNQSRIPDAHTPYESDGQGHERRYDLITVLQGITFPDPYAVAVTDHKNFLGLARLISDYGSPFDEVVAKLLQTIKSCATRTVKACNNVELHYYTIIRCLDIYNHLK